MVSKQSADPCSRQAFKDTVFLHLPAPLSSGSLSILQAGGDFGGRFFFNRLGMEVLSKTPTCIYWQKLSHMATVISQGCWKSILPLCPDRRVCEHLVSASGVS